MSPNWTTADYQRVVSRKVGAKPSKYKSRKTLVNGILFDSKKEAARWQQLVLWEKSGGIRNLRRQMRYALCPLIIDGADCRDVNAGTPTPRRLPVAYYVADFEYEERSQAVPDWWPLIVEDVKGVKTPIYLLKKHWFEAQYGIQIRET